MGKGFLRISKNSFAFILNAPVRVIKAKSHVTAGAQWEILSPSNKPSKTPVGVSKGIHFSSNLFNLEKKSSIIIIKIYLVKISVSI